MMTLILKKRFVKFKECKDIFSFRIKGVQKESYGNKDQFLINKMLIDNYRVKQKKMCMTWIDDKKLFLIE